MFYREESSTQPGPKFDPFDIQAFKQQLKTRYLGQEITYLETTGSTMDDAKSAAHQGEVIPYFRAHYCSGIFQFIFYFF